MTKYTTIITTTDSTYGWIERETTEIAGDDIDYQEAIESAKADGFSVWSNSYGVTFRQTELRNDDGDIVRINICMNSRSCAGAGIETLNDALEANEAESSEIETAPNVIAEQARELAIRAWGPTIDTETTILPNFLWEYSTPSHGGYVAAFLAENVPTWARGTWAGSVSNGLLAFVAFEEDCDAFTILHHSPEARRAAYDAWHPEAFETLDQYADWIAEIYANIQARKAA